jgi:SAM-dependent methyltransferase
MSDKKDVRDWMRDDWNARAREDANYYVAFGRRGQNLDEFIGTGADVVRSLVRELKRLPSAPSRRARRALEIGCGPGRLMLPLCVHFGEIHGLDVSDEMAIRARENLQGIPHAHVHVGGGADLAPFADDSFDFVYSYAVFQHIPSHDVIWNYLEEACRVLKPRGILRCQLNGLHKRPGDASNTWSGASFTGAMLRDFARRQGFQLLALEGEGTQYLWVTLRKWGEPAPPPRPASIVRVTQSGSSAPSVPAAGVFAAVALLVDALPDAADLSTLEVRVRNLPCVTTYIGPPASDGLVQVSALLPGGLPTGLASVDLWLNGAPLASGGLIRILPPPPLVARVMSAGDGVDIVSGRRIVSGLVKVILEDAPTLEGFHATVNGAPVRDVESLLTMAQFLRWEVNFRLPEGVSGPARLEMSLGRRPLGVFNLTVG